MASTKGSLGSTPVGKVGSSNQHPKADFSSKAPATPHNNEGARKTSANVSVIIFPGAWHHASCISSLVSSLNSIGLPTEAHSLRSVRDALAGVSDDEGYMRSVMNPLINAGNNVVLVSHLYAGFSTTSAISGIDKRGREARGEKSGVLGVIYLASFVPQEDETLYRLLDNQ